MKFSCWLCCWCLLCCCPFSRCCRRPWSPYYCFCLSLVLLLLAPLLLAPSISAAAGFLLLLASLLFLVSLLWLTSLLYILYFCKMFLMLLASLLFLLALLLRVSLWCFVLTDWHPCCFLCPTVTGWLHYSCRYVFLLLLPSLMLLDKFLVNLRFQGLCMDFV